MFGEQGEVITVNSDVEDADESGQEVVKIVDDSLSGQVKHLFSHLFT